MQKRFNQYYLTERIGSKPLRSLYLAHHVKDVSHKVLLKIFDDTCLALGLESERFLHQVEWIKQLRYMHVVPILDLGVEHGQPYVVSQYLPGGSLRRRLDRLSPGRLSLQEALKIISQVGQALSYFHEHAHLHQNVKPENIFINEQGEVLLADFRLSGFIDVAILDYQYDPRTMYYMAPEQFSGSASEKSDQYALACLAYELIAGQVPFSAQSFAMMWASHYAEFPAPLSDLVPDLPEPIEKAIFKAMAKDPSERYADVATFLLALEGTTLSPAPVITNSLALSTLDPIAESVAEPLESIESDVPIETSLAGALFEGSLMGAPFGTNLMGASFETSLTGIFIGTSLMGVPFGTSLSGNPFEKGLTGESSITILAGDPLEENLEERLFEPGLADNDFPARAEDSQTASLADDACEKSWEEMLFGASLADNDFPARAEDSYVKDVEDDSGEESWEEMLFGASLADNDFPARAEDSYVKDVEDDACEESWEEMLFGTSLSDSAFPAKAEDPYVKDVEDDSAEKSWEEMLFGTSLADSVFTARAEDSYVKDVEDDSGEKSWEEMLFGTSLANGAFPARAEDSYVKDVEDDSGEKSWEEMLFGTSLPDNTSPAKAEDSHMKDLEDDPGKKNWEGNLVEAILVSTPLTTSLLERCEHASNEPHANKATVADKPAGRTHHGSIVSNNTDTWQFAARDKPLRRMGHSLLSIGHVFRYTKYSIPALWSGKHPLSGLGRWFLRLIGGVTHLLSAVGIASRRSFLRLIGGVTHLLSAVGIASRRSFLRLIGGVTHLLSAVGIASRRSFLILSERLAHLFGLWERISSGRRANKVTATDVPEVNAHVNSFLAGRKFRSRKYSMPALWFRRDHNFSMPGLWLVLVITIIVLIGGIASGTLLTSQFSGIIKPVNQHQERQKVIDARNVPIDTKLVAPHATVMPTPQENRSSSLSASISFLRNPEGVYIIRSEKEQMYV